MTLFFLKGLDLDFSCELNKLDLEQQAAFQRFRNETFPAAAHGVKEVDVTLVDDFTLLRFLRADKYKDEPAAKRLVNTLKWWSIHNFDTILEQPPKQLSRYQRLRSRQRVGYDYQGRVVVCERLGEFFGSYNSRAMPLEDWVQCYAHELISNCWSLRKSSQQLGLPVERTTFVGDMSGIRFVPCMATIPFLKSLGAIVEVHFPETAGSIFLINAPAIVSGLFNNVVKRFLDPVVAAKIQIHSGVPTEHLLELIPSDVLPVEYGGTSKLVLPHVSDPSELDDIKC